MEEERGQESRECRDGSQKIGAGEKEGNTWWVVDTDMYTHSNNTILSELQQ